MQPDHATLQRDLASPSFREGIARKAWRLIEVAWPFTLIGITAHDGHEHVVRLDCCGYPTEPPTGGLWDMERGATLSPAQWPRGDDVFLSMLRHDWNGGTAIYFPLDRVARTGHPDWAHTHAHLTWNPAKGIVQHVSEVHRLFNSGGYHGRP
jgi:hypothetical protein